MSLNLTDELKEEFLFSLVQIVVLPVTKDGLSLCRPTASIDSFVSRKEISLQLTDSDVRKEREEKARNEDFYASHLSLSLSVFLTTTESLNLLSSINGEMELDHQSNVNNDEIFILPICRERNHQKVYCLRSTERIVLMARFLMMTRSKNDEIYCCDHLEHYLFPIHSSTCCSTDELFSTNSE